MDIRTIIMKTTLTPTAGNRNTVIIIRRSAIDSDTWQSPPGRRNDLPGHFARDGLVSSRVSSLTFRARFNDGRFRVTTEAKLPPLARFGCSMVWRWISFNRILGLTQKDIASFVGWSQSLISLGF